VAETAASLFAALNLTPYATLLLSRRHLKDNGGVIALGCMAMMVITIVIVSLYAFPSSGKAS